jgi:hypothetical protein
LRPLCSVPRKQINAPQQHRQHPPLNRKLIARSMAESAHALVCLSEDLHNPSFYNVISNFPSRTLIAISTSRAGWPDTSWLIRRIIAAPKGVTFSLWASTRCPRQCQRER